MPFRAKTKEWRKKHLDWADSKTLFNSDQVRKSVIHKKINYDLLNGKLHMSDLMLILNPDNIQGSFIPERIQHYPIMNSKLHVLQGEEGKRVFDFRVVVTNPNALSEIEEEKKNEDYYTYEWQDMREIRANALLNHYAKEQNFHGIFNQGFVDAEAVAEEIYQCDIVGGEPVLTKLNPNKVRIFMSGYSNKIEDADVIILEDYWSPGKIIDTYYDVLSPKDIKKIEEIPNKVGKSVNEMDEIDEREGFIRKNMIGEQFTVEDGESFYYDPLNLFDSGTDDSLLPYDMNGNIRVLRMYWKSRRKIKKVKSYDPDTGEEVFNFYPETYVLDTDRGEEETAVYVNEAWEGTKIGDDIYVNMRPRPVQYNRLSNPSRCHFGIIGSIYNLADNKPFSLVDMMKHYNYLYDVIHDRLNKTMAHNWGKLVQMDLAKVPKGWDIDKWMYYARTNGLYITDSYKEGNVGASTGKLAGSLNNNTTGVIDAEFGNSIQSQINLLEFIKLEMSEVVGITRQREGQISNRETVGGVERANLQSSHITEWIFTVHDDVKKRVLECFLETAKIALRGRKMKFNHILSDNSIQIMDIDGDEFAECDYGLVVDYSDGTQALKQQIETLAQAALQNQALSFSTIMKLYNSSSLAEKQRLVENDEKKLKQEQQEMQQQQALSQERIAQMNQEAAMAKMQQEDMINQRDNETKIMVAQIAANAQLASKAEPVDDGIQEPEEMSEKEREELREKMREFNETMTLERDKLNETKRSNRATESIQRAAKRAQAVSKTK